MAPAAGCVVTRPAPVRVGDYDLVPYQGLWFLAGEDGGTAATILDMGGGVWRARTPAGEARTITVPAGVEDPVLYVAEQIT